MAQFGEQLLGLLQDVEVEQRRLLRQCCAIGRQAVEVLLAKGRETEFEGLNVFQEHLIRGRTALCLSPL